MLCSCHEQQITRDILMKLRLGEVVIHPQRRGKHSRQRERAVGGETGRPRHRGSENREIGKRERG